MEFEVYKGEPPHSNETTSLEAAESMSDLVGTLRRKVFDLIVSCGELGLTDEEIELGLKISGNTERPRRRELVLQGYIVDSGIRRKTSSGRNAIVWIKKK